jgi:hypothetical protein
MNVNTYVAQLYLPGLNRRRDIQREGHALLLFR